MRSITVIEVAAIMLLSSACAPTPPYDPQLTIDVEGLDSAADSVGYSAGGRLAVTVRACVTDLQSARAELRNVYVVGDGGVSAVSMTLVREPPVDAGVDPDPDAGVRPTCPAARLVGTTTLTASPGPVWLEVDALGARVERRFTLAEAPESVVVEVSTNPSSPIGSAEIVTIDVTAGTARLAPFVVSALPPVPLTQLQPTLSAAGTGGAVIAIPADVNEVRVSVRVGPGLGMAETIVRRGMR